MATKMKLEVSRKEILSRVNPDAFDKERLNMFVNTARSKVTELLLPLMPPVVLIEGEVIIVKTEEPLTIIIFDLDLPSGFDLNCKDILLSNIIDYMSNWVAFECASVTCPTRKNYTEGYEKALEGIKSCLNHKTKPIRRTA